MVTIFTYRAAGPKRVSGETVGRTTTMITEPVTRPAVQLNNRAGRPAPFFGSTIVATVEHDYELNFTTAVWELAGTGVTPAGLPTTTNQPNPIGGIGPWTTTWTANLDSLISASGPATLRFKVQENGTGPGNPAWLPPPGIVPVPGVNEVKF